MNIYFNNVDLLQNTLLSYFYEEYQLISLNKKFSELNYEKYNTHIQPHGILESYNLNTKLLYDKANYKNSMKNGLYEMWYSNGNLAVRYNYKNGKLHGLSESNSFDGNPDQRYNYKNGKLDGVYEIWNENGILRGKFMYKNGKLNGLSEKWHNNGLLKSRINYKSEKRNGLYKEWFEDGKLFIKCWCRNDKLNGLFIGYDEDGKILKIKNYRTKISKIDKKYNLILNKLKNDRRFKICCS